MKTMESRHDDAMQTVSSGCAGVVSVLSVQAVCGMDDFVSHFLLILIVTGETILSDSNPLPCTSPEKLFDFVFWILQSLRLIRFSSLFWPPGRLEPNHLQHRLS